MIEVRKDKIGEKGHSIECILILVIDKEKKHR